MSHFELLTKRRTIKPMMSSSLSMMSSSLSAEISKNLGKKWRTLADEEKQPFIDE